MTMNALVRKLFLDEIFSFQRLLRVQAKVA